MFWIGVFAVKSRSHPGQTSEDGEFPLKCPKAYGLYGIFHHECVWGKEQCENISIRRYNLPLKGGRCVWVYMYWFLTKRLALYHHLIDPTSYFFLETLNVHLEKLFCSTRYYFYDLKIIFDPGMRYYVTEIMLLWVTLWAWVNTLYRVTRKLKKLCV